MEMRIATWSDVESVLARLSDQHKAEYAKIGYPSETFKLKMLAFMMKGDTQALWFDGKPQAVVSIADNTTWLACSKEFFETMAPTRFARKFMRDAVKRHGDIYSAIGSEHPQAAKWMKVVGFEKVDGNIFLYRA